MPLRASWAGQLLGRYSADAMQEPERQLALVLVWSQARLSVQVMPKQPPMRSSVAIPGSTIAACIGIMPWGGPPPGQLWAAARFASPRLSSASASPARRIRSSAP